MLSFRLGYASNRIPTLVLKVWKNNFAFSRLKKFEKKFFSYVGMENKNIFPDLIPHFDNTV